MLRDCMRMRGHDHLVQKIIEGGMPVFHRTFVARCSHKLRCRKAAHQSAIPLLVVAPLVCAQKHLTDERKNNWFGATPHQLNGIGNVLHEVEYINRLGFLSVVRGYVSCFTILPIVTLWPKHSFGSLIGKCASGHGVM